MLKNLIAKELLLRQRREGKLKPEGGKSLPFPGIPLTTISRKGESSEPPAGWTIGQLGRMTANVADYATCSGRREE